MELMILVRKAQAGDREAIGAICERFTGLVKKYAYQPHVRGMAEEALSQGWLEIMEGIRQYDEKAGVQFAGYIESRVKYGIWNLFKKERRRWENEVALDGGKDEDEGVSILGQFADTRDIGREVEEKWLSEELLAGIKALPEKQGWVMMETFFHHESLKNMAAQLGITPQGVYNLRKRGISSLKIAWAGMYKDIRQ